ncbi:putative Mitotic centromere-associated kinesin (MCAK) [Leptomonas pyrrhocoris]|uniref:Kinesin-like protein n=1 Tax=Leptomonas pyrrhocoris TaxID=157538 RepID=A0A0N0DQZ1_LEPPY|nr:putative Mitotic centromere-associated kinesin (MCAK) [Leptomonas pyrrhocoris]KPA73968.1 putative Mitotic centromere-associated kinesin (MCAK) [Leptomonas pyrrhocoris]|eukprot:XP_015652407.1 putative Mitotic centromere-associated kinesin (MCAK) [Leptomonas pyrrhocoris]
MGAAADGSPWASKAEASAQQARRFSLRREAPLDELPPLPPLVRPHPESTAPSLEHTPLSIASHPIAPLARRRTSTTEIERHTAGDLAVPSVSTLNREFSRLSLAYAGMREEAGDGLPSSAATHHAGRTTRRTSAPVAQHPSLPQRSRPESGMSAPTLITSSTAAPQRRLLDAAPTRPPPRRASLGVPEPPHRVKDSHAPAEVRDTAKLNSSSWSLPPESNTPTVVDGPLRAAPPEPSEATSVARQPTTPKATTAARDGGEDKANDDGNLASPLPRNPAAAKDAPAAPHGKGKGRDGRIMVVVRKRPLAANEEGPDCVQVNGPHVRVAVTKQRVDLSSYEENSDYIFDHVYDSTASNTDIYATSVKDLLTVSLAGGSASCFAYGQTGSGKTYTMMGTDSERGLYLLAAGDLFGRLGAGQRLCVCFYEIYCNSLFDLLNRRHPIVLREDANRRVNLCGVVWRAVSDVSELWQLMKAGMQQRRTGSTSANEHSSRSHAVLSIRIEDCARLDFVGTVNFVDLAGSERAADTSANDRVTRLESAEINKSLLALKECIRALDEKKKHVPFRGSRLTEVLRDSFAGNSKTVMIAAVSPGSHNHEHSNNTLRYAFRVKGLSIASVEPSKARNVPRPYVPAPRSRSNVGTEETPNVPNPLTRDVRRKDGAGVEDGAVRSPTNRRHARKGRHNHHRSPTHRHGVDDDSTSNASTAAAMSRLTEMMELSSMAEMRARRASQQRSGDPAKSSHASNRPDISSLLSLQQEEPSSRRSALRPIYKAPPTGLLLPRSTSTLSSASSNVGSSLRGNAQPLPPLGSAGSPRVLEDMAALERRLTHQIMCQLRRDLGNQLEDVLSEKDAMIAALRRENDALRKELKRTQQENGRSDSFPSRHEVGGRRSGTMTLAFYPPSPSILNELSSSGASLSAPSDDIAYRVI